VEEIEMSSVAEGVLDSMQSVSSRQKLRIEGASVETDQRTLIMKKSRKIGQKGRFVAVVSHQELLSHEVITRVVSQPDQKGVGTRSPGESGRLRVEKKRICHLEILESLVKRCQRLYRHLQAAGEIRTSVRFVEAMPASSYEEFALGCLLKLAVEDFAQPGIPAGVSLASTRTGVRRTTCALE
jgi:hypothetical protein